MHTNLLCACWHLEAMKGSSSLTSCRLLILSCLLSSLVWAQLTLLVPALGIRSPFPQNGVPIHRVRAHSLTGVRNSDLYCGLHCFPKKYAKVLGIVRSHAHLLEPLTQLVRAVNAEGCCLSNVEVEATFPSLL